MRRKAHGFTLVELMVVVALIGILAGLAVAAWRKAIMEDQSDGWARKVRDVATTANRRAVATRQPYMMQVTASSVQWCIIDPSTISGPPWATTQTGCAGIASTLEHASAIGAPNDTDVSYYATSADLVTPNGTYAAPAKNAIGAGTVFFFGSNGTSSSSFPSVMAPGAPPSGFTVYVRSVANDETSRRRRVAVYGASSKARIIANY